MLKVECESCKAPYQVDERRVPPTGLKMRCPKCGHTFLVTDPSKAGAAPAAGAAPQKAPMVKKPTMVGVGFAPPGAVTPPPPVVAAPPPPVPAPPSFDDGAALPAVVSKPKAPPPVPAKPAPLPPPDLGDLDLPALAGDVGLPAAVSRSTARGVPAAKPAAPPVPAPPAATAKPFSFEIDMPGPGADLPAPKHTLDLPMTKGDAGFGRADLPMTKGTSPGFGSVDLPMTKNDQGFGSIDLPSTKPFGSDLPSAKPGGGGFADLPSPQNNLPSLSGGGFGDLPIVQNNLPAIGGGLPMAKGGGFGEIDLPSLQNDLPQAMGAEAHLPQAMAPGAQLPMPVSDDRLLPNRPGAPPATSFGELDLPLVGTGTGLPMPLEAPQNPPGQVSFGELDLPADPSLARGPSGAPTGPSPGGMAFGEVDLGGDPNANGPVMGPPPAATGGMFQEASIEPAMPAAARRERPVAEYRAPSKAPKIIAAVAAIVVIGGAALEMTPYGAFGRIKIGDMLHSGEYATAAVAAGDDTRKKLADDTYRSAINASDDLAELRKKTPRSRPLSAYAAFVEYAAQARFGANPERAGRAKVFISDIPAGTPVPYLQAAQAAEQAASGDWAGAKESLSRAAASEPKDGIQQDIAILQGEVALNLKDPASALSFFTAAQNMAPSARASFGIARAYDGLKNAAKSKDAVDATLKASPNHAGARTMHGLLTWQLQRDDVAAMKDIDPVLEPAARKNEGPSEVSSGLAAKGWIMLARERASEARAAFDEAVKVDPRNVSALTGQGEVLYADTRMTEAMNRFSEAVKKDPTNVQAIIGEAKSKIALERLADAKTQLAAAKKTAPKDMLVTLWLARTEQALGNKGDAEKLYQNAIELAEPTNPDAVQAYAAYATFLSLQGRTADAQAKLDLAKQKLPDNAVLQRAFGDVAAAQSQWDEAINRYQSALAKNPNDLGTRFQLGKAFRKVKRIDDATKEFDKIGAVEKDFPGLALERGLIFEQTGDVNKALEQFQSALQKQPNDDDLKVRVGAALVVIGESDKAIDQLKPILDRRPQSAELRHFIGRAYLNKGGADAAQAMPFLQRAVELDPNRAEYHVYVARAATEAPQPQLGLAQQEVDKALAQDKTLADAYWQRGVVERMQNRPGDAIKDLKHALELKPTLTQAHATLAQAYGDKNDTGNALAEWSKVFANEVKDPLLNYQYGRALLDKGNAGEAARRLKVAVEGARAAQPQPGWLAPAAFEYGEALRKTGDKKTAADMYRLYRELSPPTASDMKEATKWLTEWKEPLSNAP